MLKLFPRAISLDQTDCHEGGDPPPPQVDKDAVLVCLLSARGSLLCSVCSAQVLHVSLGTEDDLDKCFYLNSVFFMTFPIFYLHPHFTF